jgi:hypothetical protein
MSKERYNQIIDEVYEKYSKEYEKDNSIGILLLVKRKDNKLVYKKLDRESFTGLCEHDKSFSERWGLKIEERELSLSERGELFRKTYPYNSVDDFAPSGMEIQSLSHQLNTRYEKAKIPTKLITLTYNDETIEIYE